MLFGGLIRGAFSLCSFPCFWPLLAGNCLVVLCFFVTRHVDGEEGTLECSPSNLPVFSRCFPFTFFSVPARSLAKILFRVLNDDLFSHVKNCSGGPFFPFLTNFFAPHHPARRFRCTFWSPFSASLTPSRSVPMALVEPCTVSFPSFPSSHFVPLKALKTSLPHLNIAPIRRQLFDSGTGFSSMSSLFHCLSVFSNVTCACPDPARSPCPNFEMNNEPLSKN